MQQTSTKMLKFQKGKKKNVFGSKRVKSRGETLTLEAHVALVSSHGQGKVCQGRGPQPEAGICPEIKTQELSGARPGAGPWARLQHALPGPRLGHELRGASRQSPLRAPAGLLLRAHQCQTGSDGVLGCTPSPPQCFPRMATPGPNGRAHRGGPEDPRCLAQHPLSATASPPPPTTKPSLFGHPSTLAIPALSYSPLGLLSGHHKETMCVSDRRSQIWVRSSQLQVWSRKRH